MRIMLKKGFKREAGLHLSREGYEETSTEGENVH